MDVCGTGGAGKGYAIDPTPHSVYVSVTDGDKQYTVTAEDKELPDLEIIKPTHFRENRFLIRSSP